MILSVKFNDFFAKYFNKDHLEPIKVDQCWYNDKINFRL